MTLSNAASRPRSRALSCSGGGKWRSPYRSVSSARALHMPSPSPSPSPLLPTPPVRYMTGLVNQSPADTSSHRPQPQRHASHDELGIRSCNAPRCCLSRSNYPTQTARPAPCARTHHTLHSCLPSSAAMPPTAPFSPCRARASSSRSASLASFPTQFRARLCIVRSVRLQDGLMDVLAASAERQKEIARAIAGELKEQDDVGSRRWPQCRVSVLNDAAAVGT
jgi:hypothetical protein